MRAPFAYMLLLGGIVLVLVGRRGMAGRSRTEAALEGLATAGATDLAELSQSAVDGGARLWAEATTATGGTRAELGASAVTQRPAVLGADLPIVT
jgi:hypothetical protein